MGTRGAWGFVVSGVEKIAYNHFDSYPDGLGVTVLAFVRNAARERPEWLLQQAQELRMIKDGQTPTAEDVERLAPWTDLGVGEQSTADWYCLLRKAQGDPEELFKAGYAEDASDFPLESLFCEWAYVVDMDHLTFEVYQGFQTEPHNFGRFASRGNGEESMSGNTYYPVREIKRYRLDTLPDNDTFVSEMHMLDAETR